MSNNDLAKGFYFNEPSDKAPEFILGSVSIRPDDFAAWLSEQQPNEKGYVRLSIKRSREGKVYAALDSWQPGNQQPQSRTKPPAQDFGGFEDDETVPF